jgi:hypothetical protein
VKFKLDENLPAELVDELRELGHQADNVRGSRNGTSAKPDALT